MTVGRGNIKYTEDVIVAFFEELDDWLDDDPTNLFMNTFFVEKGIHRQKLHELLTMYPWLKGEYTRLVEKQQYKLLRAGLLREVDASLTKFVMSSKYNMLDKTIIENEVSMKEIDITKLVGFDDNENDDI